jgi:SAM-dependent methyltransferase
MKNHKHQSIIEHYETCLALHGDSNLGVDWPNKQDAEKRYRVMLEVVKENTVGLTLLDFGCGASHLYPYLQNSRFVGLEYHGLDASQAFCDLSTTKYPQNKYVCVDVLAEPDKMLVFDYVIMNGVFTEKRDLTFDEMLEYFKQVLQVVFPKVRLGLAFNVMSKAVNWEREDLFHLSLDLLMSFLAKELSRHVVIRNDYGLYEYTVYVYKNPSLCLI